MVLRDSGFSGRSGHELGPSLLPRCEVSAETRHREGVHLPTAAQPGAKTRPQDQVDQGASCTWQLWVLPRAKVRN